MMLEAAAGAMEVERQGTVVLMEVVTANRAAGSRMASVDTVAAELSPSKN